MSQIKERNYATDCERLDATYRNPERIDELTNATPEDRTATLIELSENRDFRSHPDEPQKYRVTLPAMGEVLIERARDPEHEAARLLAARGFTGRMITCWRGRDLVATRIRIVQAAGKTTAENDSDGLRTRKFRPISDADRARQRGDRR